MMDFYTVIRETAAISPQSEVCGFLLRDSGFDLDVYPTHNVTHRPKVNHFSISSTDFAQVLSTGRLLAFYHSHCIDDETFSPEDVAVADLALLPIFVYSLKSDRFNLYKPKGSILPLEGRQFLLGFQDCVSVVTDWLQYHHGIRVEYFERPYSMVQQGSPLPHLLLKKAGFNRLPPTETPMKGDVLMFAVMNPTENHTGIYTGGDKFLHQMLGSLSSETRFSGPWQQRLRSIYRHPQIATA